MTPNSLRKPLNVAFAFLSTSALLLAASATAQVSGPTGPTPPPYSAAVTVEPLAALPGAPRTITITGLWPNGCIPGNVSVLSEYGRFTRTIVLRLNLPLTTVPCTAAITPYTLTTTFAPETEGTLRAVVVSSDNNYRGEANIVTDLPNAVRARFDITGNWYDPATNGSGLSFTHSFMGSDAVFGTWYLYDPTGMPRWYSIQAGRWVSNTQYVATLYETRGQAVPCQAPGANVCPIRFSTVNNVGTLNFTVSGRDTAVAEARNAAGALLFTSNVIRMGL